jgi:transposase
MTAPILSKPLGDDHAEVVLGVDTHKDVHVAAVSTAVGAMLATSSFPATAQGYSNLLEWARRYGVVGRAGVEGTGSYGAALARYLSREGVTVIEVNRPDRAMRRSRGKTDVVDAEAAARAVISGRAVGVAKIGRGPVEQLRVYKIAKDSAVKARVQATTQLRAILVNADPLLRQSLIGLSTRALIVRCAELPEASDETDAAVVPTLRTLARRIHHLADEIADLLARITSTVQATAANLLDQYGVGPDSAAILLIAAGDNPDRVTSESAFAALCGVSPVEMSSGKTRRRRLNRGGNRQANAALYRIVSTRLRVEPRTREYAARRTQDGRSKREIIRRLKRYAARELFQLIHAAIPATSPSST